MVKNKTGTPNKDLNKSLLDKDNLGNS